MPHPWLRKVGIFSIAAGVLSFGVIGRLTPSGALQLTPTSELLVQQRVAGFPKTQDVQMTVIRGTIPPGGSVGWHVHRYPQASYVISGSLVLEDLHGVRIAQMQAGGTKIERAGLVMRATNLSKTVPTVIILFEVSEPGKPAVESWHGKQ